MLKETSIAARMAKVEKIAQHILPLGAAHIHLDSKHQFPIKRVVKVKQGDEVSFDVYYVTTNKPITLNINVHSVMNYDFSADFTKANPQSTRDPDRFSVHPWMA